MNQPEILITDTGGTPRMWTNFEDACCYVARDKVVWNIGEVLKEFVGGKNKDGEISKIQISSIMGVTGPLYGEKFYDKESKHTVSKILFGRDRFMCAYCGNDFPAHKLTVDHVLPTSRGGKNVWMNTVASCKPCNTKKSNRTPEEAGMHLLYVPYVPNMFEKMLLKNRNILTDQMDFLKARIPKTSRIWIAGQ